MRVNPVLVSNEHQLSKINGAFNACTVEGNYSDEITLIGRGAGSYPTASAVANDIMNFAHKGTEQVHSPARGRAGYGFFELQAGYQNRTAHCSQ